MQHAHKKRVAFGPKICVTQQHRRKMHFKNSFRKTKKDGQRNLKLNSFFPVYLSTNTYS
jgi:hypothetical protein